MGIENDGVRAPSSSAMDMDVEFILKELHTDGSDPIKKEPMDVHPTIHNNNTHTNPFTNPFTNNVVNPKGTTNHFNGNEDNNTHTNPFTNNNNVVNPKSTTNHFNGNEERFGFSEHLLQTIRREGTNNATTANNGDDDDIEMKILNKISSDPPRRSISDVTELLFEAQGASPNQQPITAQQQQQQQQPFSGFMPAFARQQQLQQQQHQHRKHSNPLRKATSLDHTLPPTQYIRTNSLEVPSLNARRPTPFKREVFDLSAFKPDLSFDFKRNQQNQQQQHHHQQQQQQQQQQHQIYRADQILMQLL